MSERISVRFECQHSVHSRAYFADCGGRWCLLWNYDAIVMMWIVTMIMIVNDVLIDADRSRIRESGYLPARSSPRGRHKRPRSVSISTTLTHTILSVTLSKGQARLLVTFAYWYYLFYHTQRLRQKSVIVKYGQFRFRSILTVAYVAMHRNPSPSTAMEWSWHPRFSVVQTAVGKRPLRCCSVTRSPSRECITSGILYNWTYNNRILCGWKWLYVFYIYPFTLEYCPLSEREECMLIAADYDGG